MRYLIMGAGALGSVFGGMLKLGGMQVILVTKNLKHVKAVKNDGLSISGIWGNYVVKDIPVYTKPQEINEQFDIILLSVKSHHTEKAMIQLSSLLDKSSYIVSLQNGLGNIETIASFCAPENTIGARVIFGAAMLKPGHTKVTVYADKVLLGGLSPHVSRKVLDDICADFNRAGIPTDTVTDIHPYIWGKVLYNCALNPLGAILTVEYGRLAKSRSTRKIMKEIIKEIFLIAKAKNVTLPYSSAEEYFHVLLDKQIPPTASHRSSMLQDIEAGRITEISSMNGAIVQYGKELGISTPYNGIITNLISFKHQKRS
ncbi:MAG: ketopantoate reductase family protein [bacterium]